MATRRGILIASARAFGGVLTLGAAVAVIAAAATVPLPSHVVPAPAETVAPTPLPQSLVCPGPLLELANDANATATTASGLGTPAIVSGTNESSTASSTPMHAPDNATAGTGAAPLVVTAPDADPGVLLAASQSSAVATPDIAGLASDVCGTASADSWLVGGATTVGRTSFVLLSNPTEVTAAVDLTIYAENGVLDAPGATKISVPANSQRVFSLAGFAPNVKFPVVHVVSAGGSVVATLQQSVIRGLEPGGVELIAQTAAPSTSIMMAGVQIVGTSAIAEKLSLDGYADLRAALRVYVPGTEDATLTVKVASESSGTSDGSYTLSAAGGVVSELPLRDLPDGTYAIAVDSTVPVIASARTSVIAGGAVDFSWNQAASPLAADVLVPVATGPAPRMHFANSGKSDATVTLTRSGANQVKIVVPAGGTKGIDAAPGTVYTAATTSAVSITVGYSGNGQLSAYAVPAPSALVSPIVVYP